MSHDEESEIPLLPVVRLGRVKTEPNRQRWLIQGLWAEEPVGYIGGTPKSGKAWLALEMALAVASATDRKCLPTSTSFASLADVQMLEPAISE